jgi:hypothetical protein
MPRGAALDFSTPAMRQQTRSRSAPPVVIARAAPCAPINAPPVAQVEEVTESSDAPMPTVVATAVPADDDVEAAIQRRECEAAVAQLRATTLQITTQEQKLLNYRKSVKVYAILDAIVTLFAYSSPHQKGNAKWWARACLVFLINPVVGYAGARMLHAPLLSGYLWLCSLKEIYILVLFSFHATGSFLFFTFVVQLWITTVSYKLWRLLAPVAPERARALANGTVRARTSLVLF